MTDPRTLGQLQKLHPLLTAKLIQYVDSQGLQMTWGETYRPPAQAAANAASGAGIIHSLHIQRLAVDLQLFKSGEYLTDDSTGAYTLAGVFWESLDPLARWGGRFARRDYDHFSLTFGGFQ